MTLYIASYIHITIYLEVFNYFVYRVHLLDMEHFHKIQQAPAEWQQGIAIEYYTVLLDVYFMCGYFPLAGVKSLLMFGYFNLICCMPAQAN